METPSYNTNPLGVPLPPTPLTTDIEVESEWEWGESNEFEVSDGGEYVKGTIEQRGRAPKISIKGYSVSEPMALWSAVWWAREYRVPGVWKEAIYINGTKFRLGGLYRYADFPLDERETGYEEHGETPCTRGKSSQN